MKKIIGFLSFIVVLATLACNNQPAEVKKEIIVVPSTQKVIVKDPPVKSTTIILDKNGVKVGTRKVDVTIKQ